ncbi:hypothetical protein QFC19_008741 [Naganishia cerealis]|uniref:Uncharacterized protein n=1 Tax=Naganishia cerealis TaxID=610337 RepID=A0ACC2UZY7_9TREE|nr:hypothetical protein QFC19_008741 [Naganishia cerealis]
MMDRSRASVALGASSWPQTTRSATRLSSVAVEAATGESDDTQSLASDLSRIAISETSVRGTDLLARRERRDSARSDVRPPIPGKGDRKWPPKSNQSDTTERDGGPKRESSHKLDGFGQQSTSTWKPTRAVSESAVWRGPSLHPERRAAIASTERKPLFDNNRPLPGRPAAQDVEHHRYELRSHAPAATAGKDTRWQGPQRSINHQAHSWRNLHPGPVIEGIPTPRKVGHQGISSSSIKLKPITQSLTIPPHLQHPFRLFPSGKTFDISHALQSESVTERHPSPDYFELAMKSPNVYYGSDTSNPLDSRKLVVLDLNGAMLVRSKRSSIPSANIRRQVYPRPFLESFLNYIFSPARATPAIPLASSPPPGDAQEMRPYEAFVWSSAQPVNVDSMLRFAFGKWAKPASPNPRDRMECEEALLRVERVENRAGRVLGVWTRDQMDLTRREYGEWYCRKSTTYKDLSKVFHHFASFPVTNAQASRFYRPDPDFTPCVNSTLLIDDSTIKACMQPFNHIPIPEYTLKSLGEEEDLIRSVRHEFEGKDGLENSAVEAYDARIKRRAHILRLIFGSGALAFYSRHGVSHNDAAAPPHEEHPKLDGILLAVTGILSEVKDVVNLPAWIAAGGLIPDIRHTFTYEMAEQGWEHVLIVDSSKVPPTGMEKGEMNGIALSEARLSPRLCVPTLLPSHPDYKHWYQSPLHLLYWVRRGLVALDERGISYRSNLA